MGVKEEEDTKRLHTGASEDQSLKTSEQSTLYTFIKNSLTKFVEIDNSFFLIDDHYTQRQNKHKTFPKKDILKIEKVFFTIITATSLEHFPFLQL